MQKYRKKRKWISFISNIQYKKLFWNDYTQEKIKHLKNLLNNNHLSFYKFMKLKKLMRNWIEIMHEKLILIIYPFLNFSARLTNKCRFTLKQSYSLIVKKNDQKSYVFYTALSLFLYNKNFSNFLTKEKRNRSLYFIQDQVLPLLTIILTKI